MVLMQPRRVMQQMVKMAIRGVMQVLAHTVVMQDMGGKLLSR